jgi:phosphoheptose isomerase
MKGHRPRRKPGAKAGPNEVELVLAALQESARAKIELGPEEAGRIALAARMMVDAFRQGHKVILFGNGGSAADAQHIAAELVGKFGKVRAARLKGARTIGMTGLAGEPLRRAVDLCLTAPSHKTPRIQEVHITMGHIICELVENSLFG